MLSSEKMDFARMRPEETRIAGDLLWINRYKDNIGEFYSLKNAIADKFVDGIARELVASNANYSCPHF